MPQVCVFPKDVATLTGHSHEGAKCLLQRVRRHLGKPTGSCVSIGEFCRFTGRPEREVAAALNPRYALGA